MRGFKAFYGAPQSNLVKIMKSFFVIIFMDISLGKVLYGDLFF